MGVHFIANPHTSIIRQLIRVLLILVLFGLFYTPANAQECAWLTTVRTRSGGGGGAGVYDNVVDGNNDIIAVGTYSRLLLIDTFSFGSTQGNGHYIAKYNTEGEVQWVSNFTTKSSSFITRAVVDNQNNIYVAGEYQYDIDFGNGVTTSAVGNKFSVFIAKFNSSGVAVWARTIIPVKPYSWSYLGSLGNALLTIDGQANIITAFSFTGSCSFSGVSTFLTSSYTDVGLMKCDSSGTFMSANSFGSPTSDYIQDIATDASNMVYAITNCEPGFSFMSNTYNSTGSFLIKLDPSLSPIQGFFFRTNDLYSGTDISRIAVRDNGNFFLTGEFRDSINLGGQDLYTPYLSNFIAYFDANFNLIWAKKENSKSILTESRPFAGIAFQNNHVYFGGIFWSDTITSFGSFTMQPNHPRVSSDMYIVKMDTLGNFLWAFNSGQGFGSSIVAITPDKKGDIIISGNSDRSIITLFTLQDTNDTDINRGFTAKITDYYITRGFVYPGPYCAGDSIDIPYAKNGKYDVGNNFIAQLSDSAGNFDGGEHELGRVADTANGVIKGALPLFDVATNNKYRIRILSTKPAVQSFYKRDTLRLLIFSKDTADAGPDVTICQGTKLNLSVKGGSKWAWFPTTGFLNPADSSNRRATTKPDTTIEYRIIISDSSGCGLTDTDYVAVTVKQYIKATIIGSNIVCTGHTQTLKANVTGGDSAHYWYAWRNTSNGDLVSTGPTADVKTEVATLYGLTIGDSCTDKTASAFFSVQVTNQFSAIPGPDTVICKGKSATLRASGNGCNPNYYKFQWFQAGNPVQIGSGPAFVVSPNTTTVYSVIVSDSTTDLSDTVEIKVTVDSVFSIKVTKDSTICAGQPITLTTDVFSCDTSQMEYVWDNGLGIGQSKTINPTTTKTYTVIGTNLFNGLKDTAKVTVTVLPPLKVTVNPDTTICYGQTAQLRATTQGGNTATHHILWKVGMYTDTNKIITGTPSLTTTYIAILTDGCTVNPDTAQITVNVRAPLSVDVNIDTTICLGQSAQLRASLSGGYTPSRTLLWSDNNSTFTNTNPAVVVSPLQTTTYKALLTDNCTNPADSAVITITVRPPLKVKVTPDTTICTGQSMLLNATLLGGNTPNHSVLWTMAGDTWTDTNKSVTISPTATTTYQALLRDNCTTPSDSSTVTVTVRPPLQVSILAKDSICANQIVLLTANVSGGFAPNYSILWTDDKGLFSAVQNPATDTPKTNTKYSVQLSDNCSPAVYDTLSVTVLPVPKADFTFNPIQGCPPLQVTFTDLSTGNDTTLNTWKVENNEANGIKNYTHNFVNSGSYGAGLIVSNSLGCTDYLFKNNSITVFAKPQAQFIVKPVIRETESPVFLYNTSQRATDYTWDFGDGNFLYQNNTNDTLYTYNDTGNITIRLIAKNARGCLDTQTQLIRVFDKINCVIPNAFTPGNSDNLNPVFAPQCVGVATYHMTIYSRWGQILQDCDNCVWDGTYADSPVPAGVYLYQLKIIGESKKEATSFGMVQVLR